MASLSWVKRPAALRSASPSVPYRPLLAPTRNTEPSRPGVRGSDAGRTALDDIPPQTRPGYVGDPWFLGAAVAWQRLRDHMAF